MVDSIYLHLCRDKLTVVILTIFLLLYGRFMTYLSLYANKYYYVILWRYAFVKCENIVYQAFNRCLSFQPHAFLDSRPQQDIYRKQRNHN